MPGKYKLLILVLVVANMVSFGALGLVLSQPATKPPDTVAAVGRPVDRVVEQVAALPDTPTPTGTSTSTSTLTPTVAVKNTATATATRSRTPTRTFTPAPTRTATPPRSSTPVQRPPTNTPPPAIVAAPRPAPPTEFDPPLSQVRNVSFHPADVAPGQQYWHLAKMIYCDAYANTDPRIHNYNCDEMPGGPVGTSIYVMTGGAGIDVIAGGVNYGDRPDIIGDIKSPTDMCNCTYAFEVSNYRISVRGLPSDSIEGFCLCSTNGVPILDGHAHVRYFLYWAIATR